MQRRNIAITAAIITIALLLLSITTHPIKATSSLTWRKLLYNNNIMGPYQAPLIPEDIPEEEIIPQSYIVFLHQGCGLDDHKCTLSSQGVDLESKIQRVFPEKVGRYGTYYGADDIDDDALEKIRKDVNVDMVEYERSPKIPTMIVEE